MQEKALQTLTAEHAEDSRRVRRENAKGLLTAKNAKGAKNDEHGRGRPCLQFAVRSAWLWVGEAIPTLSQRARQGWGNRRYVSTTLILRRLFDAVHDDHRHSLSLGLELEAKLLFNGGNQRRTRRRRWLHI